MNSLLDVIFYLKTIVKFDKFKVIQFNQKQILSLDYIKKENILNLLYLNDKNEVTKTSISNKETVKEKKRESVISYFVNKIPNKTMSNSGHYRIL